MKFGGPLFLGVSDTGIKKLFDFNEDFPWLTELHNIFGHETIARSRFHATYFVWK